MDLHLNGRIAIVTGATRGIGLAIARTLLREGCIVGVCGRNGEDLERAVSELRVVGKLAPCAQLDITSAGAVHEWIQDVVRDCGSLDILISNVSAQSGNWDRAFATDVAACVQLVQSALPALRASDAAAIVGIASQAATLSVPSYKAYAAMKAALVSYMSSLAREMAGDGIRVNVVSPGEVEFPGGFWDRIKTEDPNLYRTTLNRRPAGRFARAEEIAAAVAFLVSPAAGFISGANLFVDMAGREHVDF